MPCQNGNAHRPDFVGKDAHTVFYERLAMLADALAQVDIFTVDFPRRFSNDV